MTDSIKTLIYQNQDWAQEKKEQNPDYFIDLAKGQRPEYLVVECVDSRQSIQHLTGSDLGRFFVCRNVANQVVAEDTGLGAALEFGIHSLKIRKLVVCGHYGCGGVMGAMKSVGGTVGEWVKPISELYLAHESEITALTDDASRQSRLVDLNVMKQLDNLKQHDQVRSAIESGISLQFFGLVFDIGVGRLVELDQV